jgi:hypothetical protein
VTQNLRQGHQVISIVIQELVRHRMPKQMWVQLDASNG